MTIPVLRRSDIDTAQQAANPPEAEGLEDQRKRPVRELLLDAAERLFGRHGIEGVSLREVGAAAGQRNNSAVQYHFGDKQGLVDALIADRIHKVEVVRQGLVDKRGDLSACSTEELLRMMWAPLLDLDADRDGHWFIQFQLSYQIQNAGSGHPIASDPAQYPASNKILGALQAHCAHLSAAQFQYRLGLVAMMFWAAVAGHDNAMLATNQRWSTHFALDEIIKLAVASLRAAR
jgi:TetR/AcrR family transcriptional regulator, regulator of cefoperazone and chloramphenicol sensitivity